MRHPGTGKSRLIVEPSANHGTKVAFKAQSGTTNDAVIGESGLRGKFQNVTFRDQMPSYEYTVDSEMDETRMLQDKDDATLDNFFSRPIKIFETNWGTGTTLGVDFNPWQLYFGNKRVINRINNYNLLRAKLKLKFVINGNGFQYGRAVAAYMPYYNFDTLSTFASLVSSDLVQLTQLPHIYLDPTTSTGGEITLPFFTPTNYLEIPSAQWNDMGQIFMRSFELMKHANGATDNSSISVFAWAEDVELSILTSYDSISLVAQSGAEDEIDEANKKGYISKPASAVAKMANALSAVPVIRPYAMATSTVASAVEKVAKQFGYCRPPVTENPAPRRLFPTSQLATSNTPDTALKLTVDDKQELSIDPRIAGLGSSDPLTLKEIAKREAYLTQFTWALGDATETLLWNARVDPVTWAEDGLTPNGYHFPPCAMAALPFKFWTGTMRFRFQLVCSAFHKGRLKFVYDPQVLQNNEYNTNYLEVIDIADTQDFTIEIGNGQFRTLLDHHSPGLDSVTQMYSSTTYTNPEQGNGVVGVYVVNELTTPNSTVNNDIQVNVFVSMGDDFEVFVPDDFFQHFVFKAQSGTEADIIPESQNTEEPSAPQQSDADVVGPGTTDNAKINTVFTGESITSFRTMLKRYNLWRRESITNNTSNTKMLTTITYNAFPFLRGNVTGAVDTANSATTANSYNYVNTVLLHWVTYAFQGWRGSIRYKFLNRATDYTQSSTMYVQRKPYLTGSYNYTSIPAPVYGTTSGTAHSVVIDDLVGTNDLTGVRGLAYMDGTVNANMEFEVPFYSPLRFAVGKQQNLTTASAPTEGFEVQRKSFSNNYTNLDVHVATGEDFQVYFWTGLPRMYYEASPPVP